MPAPDRLLDLPNGRGRFRRESGMTRVRHWAVAHQGMARNGAPWPDMHIFPEWEFTLEAVAAYGDPDA